MRWTRCLIPTSRRSEAGEKTSYPAILVRAGYAGEAAPGYLDWLPLGCRVLRRLRSLLREELSALSGQEIGRAMLPGSISPSPFTRGIRSHRQLPQTFYSFKQVVLDDAQDRAWGPRNREVCEALFYGTEAPACAGEVKQFVERLGRVSGRLGLKLAAATGAVGNELYFPFAGGPATLAISSKGNYAAPAEEAAIGTRSWTFGGDPASSLQRIHTPGATRVAEVGKVLGAGPEQFLKTLVFGVRLRGPASGYETAENLGSPRWVVAVVRGDHEVSAGKLSAAASHHFQIREIELADDDETRAQWTIGFVGPDETMRKIRAVMIVDPDAAQNQPWIAGGNAPDFHQAGFNWFRECGPSLADPAKVVVEDIRKARPGDTSPLHDGGRLQFEPAVCVSRVVGGDGKAPHLTYQDASGKACEALSAAVEVDLTSWVGALATVCSDERGLAWPEAIAPVQVVLTQLGEEGLAARAAEELYQQFTGAGIEVLLDDRPGLRAGSKFADADLVGIPWRITLGERSLAAGEVELKQRTALLPETVKLKDVCEVMRKRVAGRLPG